MREFYAHPHHAVNTQKYPPALDPSRVPPQPFVYHGRCQPIAGVLSISGAGHIPNWPCPGLATPQPCIWRCKLRLAVFALPKCTRAAIAWVQSVLKVLPVHVIEEYLLAPVTPAHQVRHRPGILEAQLARHGLRVAWSPPGGSGVNESVSRAMDSRASQALRKRVAQYRPFQSPAVGGVSSSFCPVAPCRGRSNRWRSCRRGPPARR
jgi:hypothetical protein